VKAIDIFPWNENFNTGLATIDAQHQKLVQLLNLLASHIAFESNIPTLNDIFDELTNYTVYHFKTEEAIWHEYFSGDELESKHKETHAGFIEAVIQLRREGNTQSVETVINDVLAFLTRWLVSHILENDRYLAMVVLAKQTGLSLEEAKVHAVEQMTGSTKVLIDIILSIYESLSANTFHLMRELVEHRRDETSLRQLLLAVEQSPSAIVITDLDANIEFVNEAFVRSTGYSRAEAIGQNPRILKSGKTTDEAYMDMWATLTRGDAWKGEFINQCKDGSEFVELALISPVHQVDGKITHYLAIKEDITERKQLERRLSDQLSFTQSIIDAEADGVAVYHAVNYAPYVRFTVWNRSMELLTGYALEEINQFGWEQILPGDHDLQNRVRKRMSGMRNGEQFDGDEWTITRKNGEQRIVQISTTQCMQDHDGEHVLAVMNDITVRKQAETALKESNYELHSLLNSMAEGAYGVDTHGNCKFVNQSFLRILGYDNANEIIGKHIHELIHHSHPDGSPYPVAECRMYAAYLCNQKIHVEDEVFWHKDGTAIPVEYWSQPIITDGVVTGAIATFVDITERKQAEAAALLASQYARSLIEASLDPLVTINAEGKITDVNTATEQVTGIDRAHLTGSDFADYFTDPEKARAGYQKVFSNGYVTDYPLAIRHISGKVTDVLYNASVYRDGNGKVLGVFAAARDITERKQMEARLKDSESRLRAIIENEPECIKIVDANGNLVQMNPAGLKMIEADSAEQVVGKSVLSVIAPEHLKAFADMHERIIAGKTEQLEYEIIGIKGGRRWVDTHAVPMQEADGHTVHLAVTRDIQERKQAEHQLRIAATVFESQEGMMVTDANQIILKVNKAFALITGYSAEEVIGKSPSILQSGRHHQEFYDAMWETVHETGAWEGEVWSRRKNGEIYPEYLAIAAVKNQEGMITHYVGTLTDITFRKASEEEIERLAFYDPLTRLPNRRLLQERLKTALALSHRSGRKGALLFIDLDNFKALNDTLGHAMGDLLLQQVAERLVSSVREHDTVARLGGDEFVIMLEGLSMTMIEAIKQSEAIGNKILAAINQPFQLGKHEYLSTPSIGIALFDGSDLADELLKHADIAMYQAKTSGRNALRFFDPHMQHVISARVSLEDELRKALVRQQFELYYQIQVENPQRVVGVEALIRWSHPERGLIQPSEFIPLAEETGLILSIGQWVLEKACAQLNVWQQEFPTSNLALSVNVSAKQFFQADFAAQVQACIQRHAINPKLLKLELTESILIKNIENTIATMNALGEIGVQFSLDDFGTGYSSLQYLKRLPLTQLKIDRSFVKDIAIDKDDQAIVRTIVAMATSLNLSVIAEGVETEQQLQLLSGLGCANYQGYLFSRPVPIEKLDAFLRQSDNHCAIDG
jgi:diguanylate cyclase (GGDEF)-like protein/hemerythrin-like metal-binding protein/PAS domain S-box-containing protein